MPLGIPSVETKARTARIWLTAWLVSGKPWTFVATYVAIEIPPSVMYATLVYLLPTRVYGFVVRTSSTESMTSAELAQKNVAMIASPRCGFLGLKPLTIQGLLCVGDCGSWLIHVSNVMPPELGGGGGGAGGGGCGGGGGGGGGAGGGGAGAVPGLSSSAPASQVLGELGELKAHVHCGSTLPPPASTAYRASAFSGDVSDDCATIANGGFGGGSRPTNAFAIVTP